MTSGISVNFSRAEFETIFTRDFRRMKNPISLRAVVILRSSETYTTNVFISIHSNQFLLTRRLLFVVVCRNTLF
jgi:hypothetical protein